MTDLETEYTGRCAAQTWGTFQEALAELITDHLGVVVLRSRAGRTLEILLERSVVVLTVLARPVQESTLSADGWERVGKVSAPAVRRGWETGAVSGRLLRHAFPRPAEEVPGVLVALSDEFNAREVTDLRFTASTAALAQRLRTAPGSGNMWSHSANNPLRTTCNSGPHWKRENVHCIRCGNRLADAVSIARGYGPDCYAAIQQVPAGRIRLRRRE